MKGDISACQEFQFEGLRLRLALGLARGPGRGDFLGWVGFG